MGQKIYVEISVGLDEFRLPRYRELLVFGLYKTEDFPSKITTNMEISLVYFSYKMGFSPL